MRKSNHGFNAKRGGFSTTSTGRILRHAKSVASGVSNVGLQLLANPLLTGLLTRVPAFKVPHNVERIRGYVSHTVWKNEGYTAANNGVFGVAA